MKFKLIVFSFFLSIITISSAQAQDYKNALGIRLSTGAPAVHNSITFKHFFSNTAVEVLASFSDPFAIGALLERHNATGTEGLYWFYGGGAYGAFGGNNYFGAMGIIGLDYKFSTVPINISLDWKPELNILKNVGFEPSGIGFSVRFAF